MFELVRTHYTVDDAFRHLGEGVESFFPPEQHWQDKVMFAFGVCCWVGLGFYYWRYL